MAKLESFATLNISNFQAGLKRLESEVAAFERSLAKKKFEVSLSVNTKGLDAIGKVSFDRITNEIKQFEAALKKLSSIDVSANGLTKLSSLANISFGQTSNQLQSLAKALEQLKTSNFTFSTKGFESIAQIDFSSFIRQLTNLSVIAKNFSGLSFKVDTSGLQKLSTLDVSAGIKQLMNLSNTAKGVNNLSFKVDTRGLDQLSRLRFDAVALQLPQLAKALQTLQGTGVNLNISSLKDLAKLDVAKVKTALEELVPTLQKLNNINIRINIPNGVFNQINQFGNNLGTYSNFTRSFAASIGLISPQMSSMFYWTGRVAEGLGLYNNTSTLAKFATIGLVTAIGSVIAVMATLGITAVTEGRKLEDAFAVLKANGVEGLSAVKTALEEIRNTDISTARRGLADYGQALADLTRAGQTGAEGLTILKQASFLATAEGTNLSDSSIELTRNLLQFSLGAESAARAADALTLASNDAVGTQSDLSRGLNVVGVVAKNAGFSLEETLAALVELDNKGLSAADKGATALRNVLAATTSPTNAFREAAKGLGVDLVGAGGDARQAKDIIFDLVKALKAGGVSYNELTGEISANANVIASASQLFRTRGFAAILSLSDGIDVLAQRYRNGAGAAEKFAETLSQTLTGELERLQSSVKDAGVELFQLVGPSLVVGIKAVSGAIGSLRDGLNAINDSKEVVANVTALGAGLLVVANSSKIAAAGVVAFNTVSALLTPIGQAGIVTLTGYNIAFARLSVVAKLAAIAVGIFQKASALLLAANPITIGITAGIIALGAAITFATKSYNDLERASDAAIKKNLDFVDSLKKAQEQGNKLSPELGKLRGQEFVQQQKVKDNASDPNVTGQQAQAAFRALQETRKKIQDELNKFKPEQVTAFTLSEDAQKSFDALLERAESLKIRFDDLKGASLDKTFLDINASVRELIKGLSDIPELSGNAKAYQQAVDGFVGIQNDLQARAIEASIVDSKKKNADTFSQIERQKTSLLKDESRKRKLELQQELADIDEKYRKEIDLAQRNLKAAQSNKNTKPQQIADLQGILSQVNSNRSSEVQIARDTELKDQKAIAQSKLDKEIELQNKIVALRQESSRKQLELYKIQSDAVDRSYLSEIQGAKDNIKAKIEIDSRYRAVIIENARKQVAIEASLAKTAAAQQRDTAIRDAQKVSDPAAQNKLINLAKGNYQQEVSNIQAKSAQDIAESQRAFDDKVADHRRELAETYYRFKLARDKGIYENETRNLDDLSAAQLDALRKQYAARSALEKSQGNTRSSDLANEFARKVINQQQSNSDSLSKKIPEINKDVASLSKDLNDAINKQEGGLDQIKTSAASKYLTIVSKAKDQLTELNKLIEKTGGSSTQSALAKQLQSIVDLGNAKAKQAATAAEQQFNRGLNDAASNRSLELASRVYDATGDAQAYRAALSAYEGYWQQRLEIARKNKDPEQRASQVSTAQDNVYAAQQKLLSLSRDINDETAKYIKLQNDILQNSIDQTDDYSLKLTLNDALLQRLREQQRLAKERVDNAANPKERNEALSAELEIQREISSTVQQRNQLEENAFQKQKAYIDSLIQLRQSELSLQQKQADTDSQVLAAYEARIALSKESLSAQRSQVATLESNRQSAQSQLNSLPANAPGRDQLATYIESLGSQIRQTQVSINNELANGLDLQKGKQSEIATIVGDELQTTEALSRAYNSILGQSNDIVANAKNELDIARAKVKAVEDQIAARGDANKSNTELGASTQGRAELRDRANALEAETKARRNLIAAEGQQANEAAERDARRKKLIVEISGIDNADLATAKIDLELSEKKLVTLADQVSKAEDLVSFGKLSRDYADAQLQLERDKLKVVELEASTKFKSATDNNNRDLQIAQAQLAVSTEAGNQALQLSNTINNNIKQLDLLIQRRGTVKPGSNAAADNEVAISQKQAEIANDIRLRNVAISDQKRTAIELVNTQVQLENRLRGYGQDSVKSASQRVRYNLQMVDVLQSQISTTTDRISKEQLLKQLYQEQLNTLDLQDAKARSIAEQRKLSVSEAASAKEVGLVSSRSNTPLNLAKVSLESDRELVDILNQQLASTTDINERSRLRSEINQTLLKQYEDQRDIADAQRDSLQSQIDLDYAKVQLASLLAGYSDDGIKASQDRLKVDEDTIKIMRQELATAANLEDAKRISLDITTKEIAIERDKLAIIKAQAEQRKSDIDLQQSVAALQDSLSDQFVTRTVAATRSLREAAAALEKANIDLASAGNDKDKQQAQIGVNNAQSALALKRKDLARAQNEDYLSSIGQIQQESAAQLGVQAAITGNINDAVEASKDQLTVSRETLFVLEQRLRLAEGEEAKSNARIAILQQQKKIEEDIRAIREAELDRMDQINARLSAQNALSAAVSGADRDTVAAAESKLSNDKAQLSVLEKRVSAAKGEQEVLAAQTAYIQKQTEIQKDREGIDAATYNRSLAQVGLNRDQLSLMQKQAELSLARSGGSAFDRAELAANNAAGQRLAIQQQINVVRSKEVKGVDEQIAQAKELNDLQGQYLDAQKAEVEAEQQYQLARRGREELRLRLNDAGDKLIRAKGQQPDSEVGRALISLEVANQSVRNSFNATSDALSRVGSGIKPVEDEINDLISAFDASTQAIEAQRGALESLAGAYESQISGAISLTSATREAQKVFNSTQNLAPDQIRANANRDLADITALRDQLAERVNILSNSSSTTSAQLSSAISELTAAEKERIEAVKEAKKANNNDKFGFLRITDDRTSLFSSDGIAKARRAVSDIAANEAKATSAREDALKASNTLVSDSMNLFSKTFGGNSTLSDSLNRFSDIMVGSDNKASGDVTLGNNTPAGKKISTAAQQPTTQANETPTSKSELNDVKTSQLAIERDLLAVSEAILEQYKIQLDLAKGINGQYRNVAVPESPTPTPPIDQPPVADQQNKYQAAREEAILAEIQRNADANRALDDEAIKQSSLQTEAIKKRLDDTRVSEVVPADVKSSLSGFIEEQLSSSKGIATEMTGFFTKLTEVASSIKPAIVQLPKIPEPVAQPRPTPQQIIQPSRIEGDVRGAAPVTKNISFNFGDINQNITTSSMTSDDMGRMYREIVRIIQREYETFGKGC